MTAHREDHDEQSRVQAEQGQPQDHDPSQEWFWTPEWQEGERDADTELAAGRGTIYMSGEEFLAALKERRARHADV